MNPGAGEGLYRRLLGPRFDALPAPVRSIHAHSGLRRYQGEAEVVRGQGMLARVCAWATHLPPQSQGDIEVEIEAHAAGERWTRRIAGHAMASRLRERDGLLDERLGPARFGFALEADGEGVAWRVRRVRVLGVPLPCAWFAGVHARESADDGRYRFDVAASLPGIGLLVAYRGWLHVG